jgi:hypothetical protein
MSRRTFAVLSAAAMAPVLLAGDLAASGAGDTPVAKPTTNPAAPAADDGTLRSEILFDLVFDKGPANVVGSPGGNRVIVPVLGGTFEGPGIKGTVGNPSGDWIVGRPDGSSVLDLRLLLQTDDAQKIYMANRGIAYTMQDGSLYARIQPLFETGAAKYAWINNVVAVGVYRPMPGKIAYRVYRIL